MAERDPYIDYTHQFFRRWVGWYDLFAGSIFYAYRAAVNVVQPRPGLTMLDLCVGTGEIALRCAARGATVTGVDITPEMLDKARQKAARRGLTVRLEVMDARQLKFPDRSFDVVTISFALHDMPRPVRVQVLAEAARVCAGRLVILDYDLPKIRWLFAFYYWVICLFESPYFRTFAREDTLALFAAANLPRPEVVRPFSGMFSVFILRPHGTSAASP